jgi:transcriptional regulator with XRE-family HTH domain
MTDLAETQTIPQFPIHYRIRLACEMAGVGPEELAELLDVHLNTAHNYLAGRSKPKRPALKEIATRTRVSLQWLETGWTTDTATVTGRELDQPSLFDEFDQVTANVWWHSPLVAA